MRDLVKYLPLLKAGASKENYPLYAQSLHVGQGFVSTCNDAAYIRVDYEMPMEFYGNVNLFVLETILKTLPDEFTITKDPDGIIIKAKGLIYRLNQADFEFPEFAKPDKGELEVDEGFLSILKAAVSFTGDFEYEGIYVDGEGLIATNAQKLLLYNQPTGLKKPIVLTREIVNILDVGFKIGVEPSDNTVVTFPNGYAIFVTPHFSAFPADTIRSWGIGTLKDTQPLTSVSEFRGLLSQVAPIFFGEGKRLIRIENYNNTVEVSGESPYNGKAKAQCNSAIKDLWATKMDMDLFGAVPDGYDIHIKLGVKDIMAKNEISEIILVGIDDE